MKLRRPDFRSANTWQRLLACYWLALFVGTHLPGSMPLVPGDSIDKLIHALTFGLLAILLATTWQLAAGRLTRSHLLMVWVVIAVYGALDEWTQGFVGRHGSAGDWLADAAGALVGSKLFAWWHSAKSAGNSSD